MNGTVGRRSLAKFIREIVFGLEDSLVSTLGAVVGIAAGAQDRYIVILSGIVLVAVEAVSMTAGSFLSSKSALEAETEILREEGKKANGLRARPARAAAVMGVFYVLGGCIPLAPFIFMDALNAASVVAIALTAVTLFAVGMFAASVSRRPLARGGAEMLVVSLSAAAIGYGIGWAVRHLW